MRKLFKDLYNSFKNTNDNKFSARKLTAFTFVCFAGYIHYKYINTTNAIDGLIVDSVITLLLLGIITAQDVLKFKKSDKEQN